MVININNKGQLFKSLNWESHRNHQSVKNNQDKLKEAVRINLGNQELQQSEELKEEKKIEIKEDITKAFFALSEEERVVIKVVDGDGKLIRQIPPEEYLKMVESLKNACKSIFKKEI